MWQVTKFNPHATACLAEVLIPRPIECECSLSLLCRLEICLDSRDAVFSFFWS